MGPAILGAACEVAALLVTLYLVRQRNPELRARRLARLRAKGQEAMQACQRDKAIRHYTEVSER